MSTNRSKTGGGKSTKTRTRTAVKRSASAPAVVGRSQPPRPFMPPAVKRYYERAIRCTVREVRNDYLKIRSYTPAHFTTKVCSENQSKNRYKDVLCMDQSRITLKGENDYIHASYIDGYKVPRQYISTQGPMDTTVVDFWRMVWQERSKTIVMLCKFIENKQEKCTEYFPVNVEERKRWADFVIINRSVKNEYLAGGLSAVVRRLSVQRNQETPRIVTHYHITHWPDQGVPKDARAPLKLARLIGDSKPPVIIHCSAGIGRTGALVVLDLMRTTILEAKVPDLKNTVMRVRDQRLHSIQNDAQYLLVHRALIWFVELKWEIPTSPLMKEFDADYEAYVRAFSD